MQNSTYDFKLQRDENLTYRGLTTCYQGPSPPPAPERENGNARPTDQEPGVLDDAELLGPLPQPLLAPQEGADAGITHQLDAGLGRGPLVGGRLASAALLLIVGLIGAAHRLSILCKEDARGHSPARQGTFLSRLVRPGGRTAGSRQEQPRAPRPHPTCPSRP